MRRKATHVSNMPRRRPEDEMEMKRTKAKPKAASKATRTRKSEPAAEASFYSLSMDDKQWLRAELAAWHIKLVEKLEELLNASKEEVAEAAAEAATKLPPVPFVTG